MNSSFVLRTRILFISIFLFAFILGAKLFFVQILNSEAYSERADRQYSTVASDIFDRGSIYFSRKDGQNVFAAAQTAGFKVAIDPTKISDPDSVYKKINSLITLDRDNFLLKA